MIRSLTLALFFTTVSAFSLNAQTLLLTEDFEDDGNGSDYRANEFDDSSTSSGNDVWTRSENSNTGPNGNTEHTYSGYVGLDWWCGEDLDANDNPIASPNNNGYLMLKTIDVSAYQGDSIQLQVYLAGNTGTIKRYRANDYLQLRYATNGNIATGANSVGSVPSQANLITGTYTTFAAFYGSGNSVGTSSALIQDIDLDGTSEGSQGGADSLKNAFAEWTFKFPIGGSDTTLSILFQARTSGGSEEIGIDQIRVFQIAGGTCTQTTDTAQAGSGILASAGNTVTPYTNFFEDTRHQYMIQASEITGSGGCAGDFIGLGMELVSALSVSNNITISLKQTTDAAFSAFAFDNTGFTTVFSGTQTNVTGWNYYNFSTPFTWDGTSNIIVNWCINNSTFVGNSSVRYGATGFTSHRYAYTDNTDGCIINSFGSNSNRANIRLLYPVPIPSGTVTSPSCVGDSDGKIVASASNGTAPYTFNWSTGVTNVDSITGLSAGSYTLSVTDANGKNGLAVITVSDPTALNPMLSDTDVSCFGAGDGAVSSSATGGTSPYTYLWFPGGGTTASLSSLTPGTYTLTLTDANSCTASASATVTTPTALTYTTSVNSNVTCNGGGDGSATILVANGTPSYTYLWSDGVTTAANTDLTAGTATVTVTDANGCTIVDNASITEPTTLTGSISSSTNVSTNGGSDGSATASASGGTGPYTYMWSNSATTATASSLAAGTYTVSITDNNSCGPVIDSVIITQPAALSVTITDTDISCSGANDGTAKANVTGGSAPYTYMWSNTAITDSISGLSPGNYMVTVTGSSGAVAIASTSITAPTFLFGTAITTSNVSCNGGSNGAAALSALGGGTTPYTYLWSNGGTAATNTTLAAGTATVTLTDANGCTLTDNVTITEPTALTGSISSSTNVSTNGGSDGSATASASGGTGPYTYLWSNSATTAVASSLAAGTYTVTITDANSCGPVTDTITITQPAPFGVSTTETDITCFGDADGKITTTVTGGAMPYTYLWSNASTTDSLVNISPGNYTVTVTENGGQTATASATVNTPTPLTGTASTTMNVSCNGGSNGAGTFSSAAGGTTPYNFLWSNSDTSATNTALSAGTNTVTVTDANGCTLTDNVTITEPTALTGSISSSTNVSTNGGSDGSATASASGGTGAYTYTWSNSATTASISSLVAGTYTVTITDANGCGPVIDSVSITEPAPFGSSISATTNVSCNGGMDGSLTVSTSMGTSPFTYLWSNSATAATANNLSAGTYTVTVTENTGLTSVSTGIVTQPTAVSLSTLSTTNVSCNGGTDGAVSMLANGGTGAYTYVWSNSDTTSALTNLGAGSYTLTVTDANGCTDVSTISISEPALLQAATSVNNNVTCNGGADGSATASATGGTSPYTYAWSTGATSATNNSLAAGTYSVTVTDANGCTDSTAVVITEPVALVVAAILDSNITCNGFSDGGATASGSNGTMPYSYLWSNGATTASITSLFAGAYTVTLTDNNGCTATATTTVTEPTALSSTLSATDASCNGFSDGTISAAVAGGTPPYSYAWSSGSTTSIANNLMAGTYTVTVTDASGCSLTDQATVGEPAVLVAASTGSTDITCFGFNDGSAVAAASGGTSPYTYLWSNGGTTSSQNNLAGGTYFFTITDANGCVATNSVFIFEPNPVLANAVVNGNVSCNGGSDGGAQVAPNGGTGAYSQLWSNGDTTTAITGLAAGTYSVTVTDANGCTGVGQVSVTEPTAVDVSASVLSNVSCNSFTDGSTQAVGAGGTGPYAYNWSNGGTTATVTGLAAGTYSVTVTDNNGCTDSTSIQVTEPSILVGTTQSLSDVSCFGLADGSVTLASTGGTSPYLYNWSDGQSGANRNNLVAGTYTVTVVDANLCTDTFQVSITQPTAIVTSIVSITDVSCNGGADGSAVVGVTGGNTPYTYAWSGGQSQDTATGLAAGIHTVTVTDANGCTATDVVLVLQPAALVSTLSGVDPICNGGADGSAAIVVGGGTVPYTYNWTSGSTSDTAQGLAAGTYTVTVTDTNGCVLLDTLVLSEPTAIAASASATVLGGGVNVSCFGGSDGSISASATGGASLNYTFNWTGPNGYTGSGASITSLEVGTYNLTVSNADGCTDTTSVTLTGPTSALTASATANTVGGGFNVSCVGGSDGSITLSVNGGTTPYTYQWTGPNGFTSTSQNPSGLMAGTYNVVVTDAGGCLVATSSTLVEPLQGILLNLQPSVFGGGFNISCADAQDGRINTAVFGGGTQPYTYAWTGPNGFSATTANINNLGAGTYNLLLTDTNGCTVSDSIQLRDSDSLQLTAVSPQLANGFNTTCNESTDGSIDLTVTGGAPSYAYLWTGPNGFNALTPDLTGLLGGNYVLNVTDINGCSRSINHVVTSPAAITIAPAVTMESPAGGDGAIDLTVSGGNAPYNYSWNNGETTEDIDSLTGGTYQVVVTDDFGCMDSLEITVGSSVGIATFEALQTLKVFPNPTKDRVWLQLNGATGQYIELEILDLNGRRVFNRSFDNLSSAWETDLPLNGWPQGVYFIRVQGDDFTQVQRLVVH